MNPSYVVSMAPVLNIVICSASFIFTFHFFLFQSDNLYFFFLVLALRRSSFPFSILDHVFFLFPTCNFTTSGLLRLKS